jgi:hypothetical protein
MGGPSDTMRRAVVGPDGRAWLLELRDVEVATLRDHLLLATVLRRLRRTPAWQTTVLDPDGEVVDEREFPTAAEARSFVAAVAERIEAGHPTPLPLPFRSPEGRP